jgi:hypothetical protein
MKMRPLSRSLTVSSPIYGCFALRITVTGGVGSAISRPTRGRCRNGVLGGRRKVDFSR